ncbi:hypothetical protein GQ53DRAFT_747715 [Thozetella sp. PMI_491]|nr:hypothetical protein GQ53DRAFT_747715 [Thozetella sp. PMI_491]
MRTDFPAVCLSQGPTLSGSLLSSVVGACPGPFLGISKDYDPASDLGPVHLGRGPTAHPSTTRVIT